MANKLDPQWVFSNFEVEEVERRLQIQILAGDRRALRRQAKWWKEFELALKAMITNDIEDYIADPEKKFHGNFTDDVVIKHWEAQLDFCLLTQTCIKLEIRRLING